jgi:hypothetical protein
MKNLTQKQTDRFAAVEAKLPAGYFYQLHDESAQGFKDQAVYGVSLWVEQDNGQEETLGYVSKDMSGTATAGREDTMLQKKLLNRVAAALWHNQPRWS